MSSAGAVKCPWTQQRPRHLVVAGINEAIVITHIYWIIHEADKGTFTTFF